MEYSYKRPEKISLERFIEDFIPNFEEIEKQSGMNFQTIEVWAQTYCVPPFFPYSPATCIPIG